MLTAGSVCIDAEMKDMLNAASGNGIDSGRECYGMERYHGQHQDKLILWLHRVISMLNAMLTS